MAQRAETFRVCPKCGARNKGKWEFCVRCGESLQDVTVASSAPPAPVAEIPADENEVPTSSLLPLALLLLVVVAGTVWWVSRPTQKAAPAQVAVSELSPRKNSPPLPSPAAPLPAIGEGQEAFLAARAKLNQNDLAGAIALIEDALAKDPNNAPGRALYGYALLLSGNAQKAAAEYARAVQIDPKNREFRVGHASALNFADRLDEAADEYKSALALQEDAVVEGDLGELLLIRKHDAAAALPYLRAAAAARPDAAKYAEQMASALEQTQDLAGAQKAYEKVLEATPGSTASRGRLAEILYGQGKTDAAIALTQAGIQLDPSVPVLHRDLGSFLERSGRLLEASAAYADYARLAPNAPDVGAIKDRASALAQQASTSSP